ncbi:Pyridoxal phosphate-dependent transferase [Pseudocohnilembus persalinus]|uniref:sphinganine-1-phosphate aldolase n=1 Tax=Pseudocohnilembus persalinus TaxID=266149 RepID=A0A0V0R7B2_PSEPJ|nr:Pyridoxal phosphate-dependent transferase [Pseudocohnilembus persalinus]|eukprot:KRX10388.1 Pyridoxal phosphate-dependent transferase [Pseudocohnilembus persalinus]
MKDIYTFAYVYSYTKEHSEMTAQVFNKFVHTNVLNPMKFISLRNMEVEVVAMAASMFNGDESFTGSVSSGGSESILLAMKSYRDYYRKNHPGCDYKPEVIMCETAHPAFHKAFQLFDIQPVIIKMDQNYKMRIDETKKAINKRTCCIIVSAPAYPHGIMDPIPEIAEIGYQANIPVHVDSAIGGFYLPWLKKLGIAIPDFDFKNRGVTSINADTHKYGFAPKGSSVVIYRNPEVRVCQFSTYGEWCGGLYVSPTLLGTRNGGPIAAAWASLVGMGQSGFIDATKKTLEVANEIKEAVKQIPEIDLVGEPKGIILAIQSKDKSKFNIYHLADALETLGYSIERQANPDSIHCTIMMQHYYNKGAFVEDLKKCVQLVRDDPKKYAGSESSAAMYGMLGQIPDGAIVEDFLAKFLDQYVQAEIAVSNILNGYKSEFSGNLVIIPKIGFGFHTCEKVSNKAEEFNELVKQNVIEEFQDNFYLIQFSKLDGPSIQNYDKQSITMSFPIIKELAKGYSLVVKVQEEERILMEFESLMDVIGNDDMRNFDNDTQQVYFNEMSNIIKQQACLRQDL